MVRRIRHVHAGQKRTHTTLTPRAMYIHHTQQTTPMEVATNSNATSTDDTTSSINNNNSRMYCNWFVCVCVVWPIVCSAAYVFMHVHYWFPETSTVQSDPPSTTTTTTTTTETATTAPATTSTSTTTTSTSIPPTTAAVATTPFVAGTWDVFW